VKYVTIPISISIMRVFMGEKLKFGVFARDWPPLML